MNIARSSRRTAYAGQASRQRGFSLIEIIIVLVLIGIVLGIIANQLAGAGDSGRTRATVIQLQGLAGKIETYALDNGSAPDRLEDLVQRPANAPNWMGPYAKAEDLKDPWNRDLVYRKPGTEGRDFDLISYGADGKEGGEGTKGADIRAK
ncbi:MAG: type II secretion system major pseudopilin GspG [Pseudomonadota bacterium]|jgi:general secretion pathway protein G